ncbi:hypothetical protein BC831DRAFT_453203 [Entophlyctis helioformis]|nr:hypothetical protein BC831DRAFT_453203 [Entophlyctis helioformis]
MPMPPAAQSPAASSPSAPAPAAAAAPAPAPAPAPAATVTAATVARQGSTSHHKPRPAKTVGPYTLGKTLGQGSMGKVKIATCSVTGQQVACKIVPRPLRDVDRSARLASGISPDTIVGPTKFVADVPGSERIGLHPLSKLEQEDQRIIREISMTLLLSHPQHRAAQRGRHVADFYYLFFDLIDGPQMLDFIISHGRLKEKFARRFMRQIISAVDYCHQNSIVHRDLKIENILIDKRGQIKVIDFGLANIYEPTSLLSTFCGSLYFAAPELLSAKKYVGPEVDVWSMGVIMYVLVCGKVPFDDSSLPALHAKIKRGVVEYPTFLSEECAHLLSRMLVLDPASRATIQEIRCHPWIIKESDAPKNHLPAREPLHAPFDPEVISRMRGFEFGTQEQIVEKLTAALANETGLASPADAVHPLISGRIISAPPAAIVSVYYLVREKLAEENARRKASTVSAKSLASQDAAMMDSRKAGVLSAPASPSSSDPNAIEIAPADASMIASKELPRGPPTPPPVETHAQQQQQHGNGNMPTPAMPGTPNSVAPGLDVITVSSLAQSQAQNNSSPRPAGESEVQIRRTKSLGLRIRGFHRSSKGSSTSSSHSVSATPMSPNSAAPSPRSAMSDMGGRVSTSDSMAPSSTDSPRSAWVDGQSANSSNIDYTYPDHHLGRDSTSSTDDRAARNTQSIFGTFSRRKARNDEAERHRRNASKDGVEAIQPPQPRPQPQPQPRAQTPRESQSQLSTSSTTVVTSRSSLERDDERPKESKGFMTALFASMTRRRKVRTSHADSPRTSTDVSPPRVSTSEPPVIVMSTVDDAASGAADVHVAAVRPTEDASGDDMDSQLSTSLPSNLTRFSQHGAGRDRKQHASKQTPSPPTGRIDDRIETLFFKGLFTVSNTSAQSPPVIREDLLRVLKHICERQGIVYSERRGVIIVEFTTPAAATNLSLFKRRARPSGGLTISTGRPSASGYSSAEEDVLTPISPEQATAPESAGMPSAPLSAASTLMRESRRPNLPRPSDVGDAAITRSGANGSATAVVPPRSVSKNTGLLPVPAARGSLHLAHRASMGAAPPAGAGGAASFQTVRIEIGICKITWRGLYGIQFRRVMGDSWQYKRMCQQILDMLRI